jgi:hypothetical protein
MDAVSNSPILRSISSSRLREQLGVFPLPVLDVRRTEGFVHDPVLLHAA